MRFTLIGLAPRHHRAIVVFVARSSSQQTTRNSLVAQVDLRRYRLRVSGPCSLVLSIARLVAEESDRQRERTLRLARPNRCASACNSPPFRRPGQYDGVTLIDPFTRFPIQEVGKAKPTCRAAAAGTGRRSHRSTASPRQVVLKTGRLSFGSGGARASVSRRSTSKLPAISRCDPSFDERGDRRQELSLPSRSVASVISEAKPF